MQQFQTISRNDFRNNTGGRKARDGPSSTSSHIETRLKKVAKKRNWREALKCMNQMKKQGLKPSEVSFRCAIFACSKSNKSKEAVKLFKEMQGAGFQPNIPVYIDVLNACANDHQWKLCVYLLRDMKMNGLVPTILSYNICLRALERAKKWMVAVQLLQDMRSRGIKLDVVSYNTVISACAKRGQMATCEKIHLQMMSDGCKPDAFTYSSLLSGYRKIRDWNAMWRILDQVKASGVRVDAVIYSTVIGAYADADKGEQAFEIFKEMKANGIQPNAIVYTCLLKACKNVKMVDMLFQEMTEKCVQKNSVVFTSAIIVAQKYGDVSDAIRWFEQMLTEGIKPDWVAYMSLFQVLKQSNDPRLLDRYYRQGMKARVLNHKAKDQTLFPGNMVVDLHGWSTALARAALRNVLQELQGRSEQNLHVGGVTIITGNSANVVAHPVLCSAIQRMLTSEFSPPLQFSTRQDVITIEEADIIRWIRCQGVTMTTPMGNGDAYPTQERQSCRFDSRFDKGHPLYWSHSVLGRDDSPPPTWFPKDVTLWNTSANFGASYVFH